MDTISPGDAVIKRSIKPIKQTDAVFSFRLSGVVSWDSSATVHRAIWSQILCFFFKKEKIETECSALGGDVCIAEVSRFGSLPVQGYSMLACSMEEEPRKPYDPHTSIFKKDLYSQSAKDRVIMVVSKEKTNQGHIGKVWGFVLSTDSEWRLGSDGLFYIVFSHIRRNFAEAVREFQGVITEDLSLTSSRGMFSASNSQSIQGLRNSDSREDSSSMSMASDDDVYMCPSHMFLPCSEVQEDEEIDLHDVVAAIWELFRVLRFASAAWLNDNSSMSLLPSQDVHTRCWDMLKWSSVLNPYTPKSRIAMAAALGFLLSALEIEKEDVRTWIRDSFAFVVESAIRRCALGSTRQKLIVSQWAGKRVAAFHGEPSFLDIVKKESADALDVWIERSIKDRKKNGPFSFQRARHPDWNDHAWGTMHDLANHLVRRYNEHKRKSAPTVKHANTYRGLVWTGDERMRGYFVSCLLDEMVKKEIEEWNQTELQRKQSKRQRVTMISS